MSEVNMAPETGPISLDDLQRLLSEQLGTEDIEIIGIKAPGEDYRELTEEDKHG